MAALSFSRACKGCSQLKVRCQPGPSDASSCERCLQAGRACIPADKRRRPRDRIAELEAQVAALSRALQKQQLGSDRTSPPTTDTASNSTNSVSSPSAAAAAGTASQPPTTITSHAYSFSSDRPTGETAIAFLDARVPRAAQQQTLDLYIKRLWPLIPCFPIGGMDLDVMRNDKPVLFFSIVTFTAPFSLVPSAVRSELLRESMCMFAIELISKPNRRLDTVWSLLVACFFFRAQHGSAHVTVHQLTQMATSMAIDLGLGGAQLPAAPGVALSSTASTPGSVPELEAIEHCASPPASLEDPSSPTAPYCTMATKADAQCAWLSCFMSTSNLAIGIRRPDTSAQWTAHHQSCLDDLTRGFAAMPPEMAHNTLFLHMVRGERLCQQVVDAVKLCEPSTEWDVTSLENAQTMATLQTAIDNWTADTTTALVHASNLLFHKILLFYRYAAVIYLHEPVLHTATNKLSFGAPFRRSKLTEDDIAHPQVTGKHVASLYAMKDACLALLDLATSELDDDDDSGDENDNTLTGFLADAPLSFIAKLFHAFFILAKLHIAVTAPGNTFGVVLRPAELRFAPYPARFAALADRLERRNPGSFHYKILACAGGAGDWFTEYEASRAKGTLQTPEDEQNQSKDQSSASSASSAQVQAQFTQQALFDNPFFYGDSTTIMPATDTTADDMAAYLTAYGQSAGSTLAGNNTSFEVDDGQWQMLDRYLSSFNGETQTSLQYITTWTNWGKSSTYTPSTSDGLGPSSSYHGTLGSASYLRASAGSPSSSSDLFSFDKSPKAGTGTSSSCYGASSSSYAPSAALDSYSRLFRSGDSRSGSSAAALDSSSTYGSGSGGSSWVPALGSSSSTSGLGTSGGYGSSSSSWVPSFSGSSSSGLGAGTSGSSGLYGSSSTYGSGTYGSSTYGSSTYGSGSYGSGSGSSSTKKEWWDL